MNTRELAERLDALELVWIKKSPDLSKKPLDYLLVMDLEATCWEKYKRPAEIIEFSVVLHDVRNRKIVSEFQKYVQPTENPILSEFCKKLTGIQQEQVNESATISHCLAQFEAWLQDNCKKYNMNFTCDGEPSKRCAFVTWSDWDLGICLKLECARKRLHFSKIYQHRIDLRAIYKKHYQRPMCGLSGALHDCKLSFEGIEHCGLDDARNTARLADAMMEDGVILKVKGKIR